MALGTHAAAGLVLYAVGQRAARARDGARRRPHAALVERAARNGLTLLNAATNLVLLAGLGVSTELAALPALVVAAGVSHRIAGSRGYNRLLAWTALVLPTAWPATLPGLTGALVSSLTVRSPARLGFEPAMATLVVYGGPLYLFRCAYNLGNVVFVHADLVGPRGGCEPGLMAHETGHTLNVASFGYVFHYLGALHENVWPPRGGAGSAAYAELLAESRRRAPAAEFLEAWARAG